MGRNRTGSVKQVMDGSSVSTLETTENSINPEGNATCIRDKNERKNKQKSSKRIKSARVTLNTKHRETITRRDIIDICSVCGSKAHFEINNNKICIHCLEETGLNYIKFISTAKEHIINEFNIDIDNDNYPIGVCTCYNENPYVIPFDFFTKQTKNGGFRLILSCVCRSCNRYTERETEMYFPINIKNPSVCHGIEIDNKHKSDYIS